MPLGSVRVANFRAHASAMPLTSPSYPKGPYRFYDREYVIISYRTDPDRLRNALDVLAELELDSRGGALLSAARSPLAGLDEDTLALRAIEQIASHQIDG